MAGKWSRPHIFTSKITIKRLKKKTCNSNSSFQWMNQMRFYLDVQMKSNYDPSILTMHDQMARMNIQKTDTKSCQSIEIKINHWTSFYSCFIFFIHFKFLFKNSFAFFLHLFKTLRVVVFFLTLIGWMPNVQLSQIGLFC